jgi:hypothetical protein
MLAQPRKFGKSFFWISIIGLILTVCSKLYISRSLAFLLAIVTFLTSSSWFVLSTGPASWAGYKVRPVFAIAGIILLILFLLASIVGMYHAIYDHV